MQTFAIILAIAASACVTINEPPTSGSDGDPNATYSCNTTFSCNDVDSHVITFTTASRLDEQVYLQTTECDSFEASHCAGTWACDVECTADPTPMAP